MAFEFYFAGTQNIKTQDMLCEMGANLLRSYVNDKKSISQLVELKRAGNWSGKLIIDSGAFTVHRKGGEVNVDAYIDFLNENKDCIYKAIQLDDIPGTWGTVRTPEQLANSPIKTWENYVYMVNKLDNPKMLLPVFHQGENFKYLQQILNFRYADGSKIEYICISGNKEKTAKERKEWYARVFNMVVRSDNPFVKIHCLGSATFTDMEEFPFTSSDATSWLMSSATGSILTKWGSVLVSDQQKHDKKHLLNMSQECIDKVKELCQKYEIDFDMLPTDYMVRSNFNCKYIYEMSNTTTYKPRNLKKGGLF